MGFISIRLQCETFYVRVTHLCLKDGVLLLKPQISFIDFSLCDIDTVKMAVKKCGKS